MKNPPKPHLTTEALRKLPESELREMARDRGIVGWKTMDPDSLIFWVRIGDDMRREAGKK